MSNEKETVLTVPSISCEGCAGAIRNILGALDGVAKITVDVSGKLVRVRHDPETAPEERLRKALAEAGYEAS